jgi:hypothetical protein
VFCKKKDNPQKILTHKNKKTRKNIIFARFLNIQARRSLQFLPPSVFPLIKAI